MNVIRQERLGRRGYHLAAWQDDPESAGVLLRGNGARAFCAGGDVRALAELADH